MGKKLVITELCIYREHILQSLAGSYQRRGVFCHGTINSSSIMICKNFKSKNISTETNVKAVIMEAHIDKEIFVLKNLSTSNTEVKHMKTLYVLDRTCTFDSYEKIMFFFNIFFYFLS